jgi:pimeloyl-ACP methyl ester carboxylesterase
MYTRPNSETLGRLAAMLTLLVAITTHAQTGSWVRHLPKNQGAIVFVHGVTGDEKTTWTSAHAYWPDMLTRDRTFDGQDIYVYRYPSPRLNRAFSIDEIADNMRLVLATDGVLEHRELTFVSHSMGGIVTRAFILKYRKEVVPKIRMLYFFATPTTGTPYALIASFVSHNTQFKQLYPMTADSYLAPLQSDWLAASMGLKSYCGYETQPLFGQIIVDRASATQLCTERLDPIDANHITIVKPEDSSSTPYRALKEAFMDTIPNPLTTTPPRGSGTKPLTPPPGVDPSFTNPRDGVPSNARNFAFKEALPDRVTVIVGGNGLQLNASYATKDLERHRANGLIAVGDEHPLIVYVAKGVFYVDASVTEGMGHSVVEIKGNNFTVTPPDWDRNYSANAIEIVNAHGQPIFQMIRRRSNVIEISGIFAGKNAILDARPDKLLFRYPSWKYPGEYANGEETKNQIDPSLFQATRAELQASVRNICVGIRGLGKRWNDGYMANKLQAIEAEKSAQSDTERNQAWKKRQENNELLYRSLERQFDKDYRQSALSLDTVLERRLDTSRSELNVDASKQPLLLATGSAAGPNPFNEVCDYLETSVQRLP